MTKAHIHWALLALSNAPIQNTNDARIKADWLRHLADQLDPPKQPDAEPPDA